MAKTSNELPSGRGLLNQIIVNLGISGIYSIPVILFFLVPLVELTTEELRTIGLLSLVLVVAMMASQFWTVGSKLGPALHFLDLRQQGKDTAPDRLAAFASVMNFPRSQTIFGFSTWLCGAAFIGSLTHVIHPDTFTVMNAFVTTMAGFAGGVIAQLTLYHFLKKTLTPVRRQLSFEIPNMSQRESVIVPVPMGTKIICSLLGLVLVAETFGVLLADTKARREIENFGENVKGMIIEQVVDDLERGDSQQVAMERAARIAEEFGVELILLDRSKPNTWDLLSNRIGETTVERLLSPREDHGSNVDEKAPHYIHWQGLPNSSLVLAAITESGAFAASLGGVRLEILSIVIASILLSVFIARIMLRDISEGIHALREQVERVALGNFKRVEIFDSEDELGLLARYAERMSAALRGTLLNVRTSADRVEGASEMLATVSEQVSAATQNQVDNIADADESMADINAQALGISVSVQKLNEAVEESSGAVIELTTTGDELRDNTTTLEQRVDSVSSSVQQLAANVQEIAVNCEILYASADHATKSVEDAATSLESVSSNASEASELSWHVMEAAEQGHNHVQQTIASMESIQKETGVAQNVIQTLGNRMSEIGSMVDIIDSVADETSLLALNAAIIAAQAGEHGRGFSVVADEVKDLADRVRTSNKEIALLVNSIQNETSNAMSAMNSGVEQVQTGVDLSAQAGRSLDEITRSAAASGNRISSIVEAMETQARSAKDLVEIMEQVHERVRQIQVATSEQTEGALQIRESAEVMNTVTNQVSYTSTEQAMSTRHMSNNIEAIRNAVGAIYEALQGQTDTTQNGVALLNNLRDRTDENIGSVLHMKDALKTLVFEAEALRSDIAQFQFERDEDSEE